MVQKSMWGKHLRIKDGEVVGLLAACFVGFPEQLL
jgi:hypothetical protein